MALATTEPEFVSALREHDDDAFGALVGEYGPQIRRWIRRSIDDASEIDDIEQDVLLAVWTAAPRLREDTMLLPWLFAVTTNACRKRVRTKIRKHAVPMGLVPRDDAAVHNDHVADAVAVEMALQELPDKEAGILRLLYSEDIALPDAARRLNVSSEAAKSLAARARRRFKERFNNWFQAMAGFAFPLRQLVDAGAPTASGLSAPAALAAATALALTLAGAGDPAPETLRAQVARSVVAPPAAGDAIASHQVAGLDRVHAVRSREATRGSHRRQESPPIEQPDAGPAAQTHGPGDAEGPPSAAAPQDVSAKVAAVSHAPQNVKGRTAAGNRVSAPRVRPSVRTPVSIAPAKGAHGRRTWAGVGVGHRRLRTTIGKIL